MTTLCFYQGLRTIGGTIVEIQTDQARCLFDFGFVYSAQIDARILPRQDTMVYDCLKTGALAAIDGLYAREALHGASLTAYGDAQPRPFVLISHMHIDHMGALGLLADDAEVYMSKDSLLLYRGLAKTGDIYHKPHRKVCGMAPMRWRRKGDIRFRLIPVDHDVPGACGFEIVTPDGRVCYTGDLRIHGREGEKSFQFADAVKHADVCVTEGTMVSFIEDFDAVEPSADLEGGSTEAQVETEIAAAAAETAGIVFLNFYRRNIRRLHALIRGLDTVGRRFVLQYPTAVLYRQFYPAESVAVFQPSETGRVLENADRVSREEMLKNPGGYVLDLPYARLLDALDFQADTSLYIHSDGVPLGAYDPGYEKLIDFLMRQGIARMRISCGGHARPAHLKYLLTRIAPKTLVPLHSQTPEKISIPGVSRLLPEAGKRYTLAGGKLTMQKVAL